MTNPRGPEADFRPPEHRHPGAAPGQPTVPYIHPEAAPHLQQHAEDMQARAAARRSQSALPKYDTPVGGGGPPTHIPLLNAEHAEGAPMAAQAGKANSPHPDAVMAASMQGQAPGSIVEPPVMPGVPQRPPQPAASGPRDYTRELGLQASDMLPPEAHQDPGFQQGNGSAFAVSQPALAARYGVIRNGQPVAPQMLTAQAQRGPGRPGQPGQPAQLRPETVAGLQQLEQAQQQHGHAAQAQTDALDAEAERQVREGTEGMSEGVGGGVTTAEERAEAERRVELMDSFDHDELSQAMTQDILNNPAQREIIEARLGALSIEDLIMRNRVSQRVPIIPKQFEVTYTSMSGTDDLALKQIIMTESRSSEVTERYLLDKYAFMAITCGLTAINSNPAPSHMKDDKFDVDAFWAKFEWVMQRPLHMLASIGVNHTWFAIRVRRLFRAESVGNT